MTREMTQGSIREIGSLSTEWRGELFTPLGQRWMFRIKTNGRPIVFMFFADNLDEATDKAAHLLLLEMSWGN